jgi:NAD-dependent dihydropyrimidine dehydrogenase PreA subunit
LLRETGLIIDLESCTSCGICVRLCPVAAIEEEMQ